MKRTRQNFPDSQLQQYNFDTNTTGAPAEASEEAIATDEPEEEAEPQVEVESEDVEPFNQLKEEGDKSAIDSSSTKADDNSEKEREEPSIPTYSKTRKKYIIQDEEEEDLEEEPSIPALLGKGKGKAKIETLTPTEAKQLLDIIAAITAKGQAADALTLTHPQQTPRQPTRTSP